MSDISKKLKSALKNKGDKNKNWEDQDGSTHEELESEGVEDIDMHEHDDELYEKDELSSEDIIHDYDETSDKEGASDKLKNVFKSKLGVPLIVILVILVLVGIKYINKKHTYEGQNNGAQQAETFGGQSYNANQVSNAPKAEKIQRSNNNDTLNNSAKQGVHNRSMEGLPKNIKLKPLPDATKQTKELQNNVDELKSQLSQLSSKVGSLNTDVSGMKKNVSTQGGQIQHLNNLVGLNGNEKSSGAIQSPIIPSMVSSDFNKAQQKNEERLNSAVNNNTKQITQLQQTVSDLSTQVKQLNAQVQTVNQNLIKSAVQMNQLKGDITKLTKTVGNYVSTKLGSARLLGTYQDQNNEWVAQVYYKGKIYDIGQNEGKGNLHIGQVTENGAVINGMMRTIDSSPLIRVGGN